MFLKLVSIYTETKVHLQVESLRTIRPIYIRVLIERRHELAREAKSLTLIN